MKKVCYTCITNGYDSIKEPILQRNDWDFVLFSDTPPRKGSKWNWVEIENTDKAQRNVKIFNEQMMEYDQSMWVDGSIFVKKDVQRFVDEHHEGDFSLMKHPGWDCIYYEGLKCIQLKKEKQEVVAEQLKRYDAEGMPRNYGQVQTGVMIRNHTDEVKNISKLWLKEVNNYSKRDQLSFTYICWKHGFKYNTFSSNILYNEFQLCRHLR